LNYLPTQQQFLTENLLRSFSPTFTQTLEFEGEFKDATQTIETDFQISLSRTLKRLEQIPFS